MRHITPMRKLDLSLKYEPLILKLFIKREININRNDIAGAEGKKNKPTLNKLTSLKIMS